MSLSKLFQRIIWHNNTTPAINEDNLNAMSKAIDDIDDRVILIGDDVVTVIPQIQAYLEQAESIVEAVEELSQNPPYIGANGNWYVFDTTLEAYKDSGVDASITVDIADITMIAEGAQPYVTNTGTSTDPIFHLFLPQSPQGATGNGIANIAKTGTQGLVDTYTITMTDGTTYTFTVTNGQGIGDMTKAVYDSTNAVADVGGITDYVEGKLGTLPYTNPNLLDNPWFTVNQRGASSYNGAVYAVDRWRSWTADSVIDVSSNGISINKDLFQYQDSEFSKRMLGKVMTLSILFQDGTLKSGTGIVPTQLPTSWDPAFINFDIGNNIGAQCNIAPVNVGSSFQTTITNIPSGSTISIRAIKLELGSVSTLAMDTAPNYATELLKCQRYFYRMNTGGGIFQRIGIARASTATAVEPQVKFPTTMRSNPSVTVGGNITAFNIIGNGSVVAASSYSGTRFYGDYKKILFSAASNLVVNELYSIEVASTAETDTTYIDFSADL